MNWAAGLRHELRENRVTAAAAILFLLIVLVALAGPFLMAGRPAGNRFRQRALRPVGRPSVRHR